MWWDQSTDEFCVNDDKQGVVLVLTRMEIEALYKIAESTQKK